jgi:hypothetical protein
MALQDEQKLMLQKCGYCQHGLDGFNKMSDDVILQYGTEQCEGIKVLLNLHRSPVSSLRLRPPQFPSC